MGGHYVFRKRLISLISSVLIASLIFTGCGSNLSQSVLSKGILTKEQKDL